MKYYSDITNKVYESVDELREAEAEVLIAREKEKQAKAAADAEKAKLAAERKTRAAEVESLRKAAREADTAYEEALRRFCKDYGYYHTSITADDLLNPFDALFKNFLG